MTNDNNDNQTGAGAAILLHQHPITIKASTSVINMIHSQSISNAIYQDAGLCMVHAVLYSIVTRALVRDESVPVPVQVTEFPCDID
jgi:hypothetical protein